MTEKSARTNLSDDSNGPQQSRADINDGENAMDDNSESKPTFDQRDQIVEGDQFNVAGDYHAGDADYDVAGLKNPYLGLQAFTYEERDIYAGREQEVVAAVRLLTAPGAERVLFFVTGASGSGKSSFAQAGLLPALENRWQQQGFGVAAAVFRPGEQPLAALAGALRTLGLPAVGVFTAAAEYQLAPPSNVASPDQVSLLVIDQFEELFSQAETEQRKAIFALLADLPPFREQRLHVIATMRADYLPDLFAFKKLYEIAKAGIDLRTMDETELKTAIQSPLQQIYPDAGKRFQQALLNRLTADASEDSGYLPLLQVTLEDFWDKGLLTVEQYDGLGGAIGRRAEEIYHTQRNPDGSSTARSAEAQATMLRILLDMVDVALEGETRRDVRRTRRLQDVTRGQRNVEALVQELTTARLLTTGEKGLDASGQPQESVDIIHEALIVNWPRLEEAIEAQREQLYQRRRFELHLSDWLKNERGDDVLLTGVYLAEAEKLTLLDDIALRSPAAKEFLNASIQERDRVQQEEIALQRAYAEEQQKRAEAEEVRAREAEAAVETQRRSSKRFRRLAYGLALVLAVAMLTTWLAIYQSRISMARSMVASSQLAIDNQDPTLSVLLALEAQEYAPAAAQEILQESLVSMFESQEINTVRLGEHQSGVKEVAWSPDGGAAVSASRDGIVKLWDTERGKLVAEFGDHLLGVNSVAWHPDSCVVASASGDGTIKLWNAEQIAPIKTLQNDNRLGFNSVAWDPAGEILAASTYQTGIQLWDVESGQLLQTLKGHQDTVTFVTWSPNGDVLASSSVDGTIGLWNMSNYELTQTLQGFSHSLHTKLAWRPDGRILASGSSGGAIQMWDVEDGRLLSPLQRYGNSTVKSLHWSPNGRFLASGSDDGTIALWDIEQGELLRVLRGHSNVVNSVAWSPDGNMLLSGSDDNSIRLWVLREGRSIRSLNGHGDAVLDIAWSPDARRLVSSSLDKRIRLWNVEQDDDVMTIEGYEDPVRSVSWSPDGQLLAVSGNSSIELLDTEEGTIIGTIAISGTRITDLAWHPDGHLLAAGTTKRSHQLWDTERSILLDDFQDYGGVVWQVAWSPDGSILATASEDQKIRLWDVSTGELLQELSDHKGGVRSLAWSPVGHILASGSIDQTIKLWDSLQGKALYTIDNLSGTPHSLDWSPDGRNLVAGLSTGFIMVWEENPQRIVQTLKAHEFSVNSVQWSHDGHTLASASSDTTIKLWPNWIDRHPCTWVEVNLTPDLWLQYVGTAIYRPACTNIPFVPKPTIKRALQENPRYLMITWPGRLFLLCISLAAFAISGFLVWLGYRLIRWFVRKAMLRSQTSTTS